MRPCLLAQSARVVRRVSPAVSAFSPAASLLVRSGTVASSLTSRRSPAPAAHRLFSSSHPRAAELQPRGDFKKLTAADVKVFASFLSSPSSLITTIPSPDASWAVSTVDELVGFNNDWMAKYFGNSPIVLKPKTTEEVSKIMAYCVQERIAVVPQGGNTGLVGGSTPVYDELILSTEGMKEIRQFDEVSGTLFSSVS